MAKLKKCKSCGADIAKSAKACPSCGAKKKKIPFLLIGIAVVIALVAYGISNANKAEEERQKVFDVGEVAKVGNYEVTVKSARFSVDWGKDKVIILEYDFKNNGETNAAFWTTISAKVFQDALELESTVLVDDKDVNFDDKTREVQPGKNLTIKVAYIALDDSDLEIILDEWITLNDKKKVTVNFPYKDIK
ncbi:MAG: DUF5067 domain-containing protein [Oscillospiraceae bacterium]|nr:DUF5067 domain-containing protein [Oscillospiraceae bacterium]